MIFCQPVMNASKFFKGATRTLQKRKRRYFPHCYSDTKLNRTVAKLTRYLSVILNYGYSAFNVSVTKLFIFKMHLSPDHSSVRCICLQIFHLLDVSVTSIFICQMYLSPDYSSVRFICHQYIHLLDFLSPVYSSVRCICHQYIHLLDVSVTSIFICQMYLSPVYSSVRCICPDS